MIEKQMLNFELLQRYVEALPNQEHTQLLSVEDLSNNDKFYVYKFGEGDNDPKRPDGFPVATFRNDAGELCVAQTKYNHHTVTIASTGSGKTQCVDLSVVYNANPRQSYVLFDIKGEILKSAYNRLVEIFGKENVLVLNLLDPEYTMIYFCPFIKYAYELLACQKDGMKQKSKNIYSALNKLFQLLLPIESVDKDEYWRREGRTLVYAILLGLVEDLTLSDDQVKKTGRSKTTPEMLTFQTIVDVFRSFEWTDKSFDDKGFFTTRQKRSSLAYKTASGTLNNAGVTRANILDFAAQAIEVFSDPKILSISKYNSINIEEIANSPKCIIEVFDISHKASRDFINFVNTTFISDLLEISHTTARPLRTSVNFLLDEFASLKSQVYPNILTTGRGSGIFLHMIVQSVEQLRSRYPDEWETMLDNCDLQLFLGSNSVDTAKRFGESLGTHLIADPEAYLRGEFRVQQVPVVTIDFLLHRMTQGQVFVKMKNSQPLKVVFEAYYKTPEYTAAYPTVNPSELKSPLPKVSAARCKYRLPKKNNEDDYF